MLVLSDIIGGSSTRKVFSTFPYVFAVRRAALRPVSRRRPFGCKPKISSLSQ